MSLSAGDGAAISGALSTAAGSVNAALSANLNKKNRKLQEKLFNQANQFSHDEAILAYNRNLDAWRLQNEYNDPSNQLARYLAAGINPYNASANISSSSSNGVSPSSAASSTAPPYATSAYTNSYADFMSGVSSSLDNALKVLTATKGTATIGNEVASTNYDNSPDVAAVRSIAAKNGYEAASAESIYQTAFSAIKLQQLPDEAASRLAAFTCNAGILENKLRESGASADILEENAKHVHEQWNYILSGMYHTNMISKYQWQTMRKQYGYIDALNKSTLKVNDANAHAAEMSAYNMQTAAWLNLWNIQRGKALLPYDIQNARSNFQLNDSVTQGNYLKNRWFAPDPYQRVYHNRKNGRSAAFLDSLYLLNPVMGADLELGFETAPNASFGLPGIGILGVTQKYSGKAKFHLGK